MAGGIRLCLALRLLALMCSAVQARKNDLGDTQAPSNFVCDACVQFSTEAQMILADPETQRQAIALVSQMACQSLTPKLQSKCLDMVDVYVTDAFVALQAYLGPEICIESGLCLPELARYSGKRGMLSRRKPIASAKTCALCQDFATDALSYLERNATKAKIIGALHLACSRLDEISKQCDLLVDIYAPDLMAHLDDLTPEELCEITHLCQPTKTAIRAVKRNDCAICQFVVLELKIKLKDPVTQAKILDVLLNGCSRVQNHVDECKMIVTQYAPFILANLDNILDADALCSRIGACLQSRKPDPVEPVLALYSEGRPRHHVHVL
jgi:saposin